MQAAAAIFWALSMAALVAACWLAACKLQLLQKAKSHPRKPQDGQRHAGIKLPSCQPLLLVC